MASGGPRPGSGRRRKEPALKALTGNSRPDRELAQGEPAPIGTMIPPIHLGDLEQLIFGSIAALLEEQKRASQHYSEHVALLAVRLGQVQRLKAVLEVEGDTFTSETLRSAGKVAVVTKMVRARPEVAMLSDAMRQAQSLLGELMLNPSAALRIATGEKPDDDGWGSL
ncbi:P27 family phage terminase small subunit [Sphingomonas hengshuiensis]|uniref:Terminase n=1 Tax=Sphingomonas hengshuiensis TaxID=1609977 RepID=A0A7U4LFY3_9SPHN|nr:P27 family phage terminase small subunit [Sphingomonas hengshuiensis]AJP72935.1 hypothetical protein TS85_15765 [Sphingomonas hengshuiensis]